MTSAMILSDLFLYLKTALTAWTALYATFCVVASLPNLALHLVGLGLILASLAYFRLPSQDPARAHAFLGYDPRSLDGSPTKRMMETAESKLGLIAHRGGGLDAPENTLAALKMAKKNGAECVEFDLAFTLDGHAVVFHDDSLDRTTNGKGMLETRTLEDLKKLDAAHHHYLKEDFSPEKIPTVDEYVEECLRLGLRMIVDLKSWRNPEQTINYVCQLFSRREELYSKALVATFFPHLAYLIRRRDPNIVMALTWRPHFLACQHYDGIKHRPRSDSLVTQTAAVIGDVVLKWAFHDFLWYITGVSAVLVHKEVLNTGYVHAWRERGIRVIAWTVNNSLQRAYLTNFLTVTVMSDTMNQVDLKEILLEGNQDSWMHQDQHSSNGTEPTQSKHAKESSAMREVATEIKSSGDFSISESVAIAEPGGVTDKQERVEATASDPAACAD